MEVCEIRPHTTYIGHGGLQRKVKSIQMNVAGGLGVEWKAVKLPRNAKEIATWGVTPIEEFATWALSVTDTLSDDLLHYLP